MAQTPSIAQQEQYLNNLKAEVQTKMVQDLMSSMSEKCFTKCTGKSGEHLDSKEKQCLVNCMDRYMETMNVVNQVLVSKQSQT